MTTTRADWFRPPSWVTGHISAEDAQFLIDFVRDEQPSLVVELGIASGASSAALLYALDRLDGARMLVSADTQTTCYFNRQRKVGAAVAEMYPHYRATWRCSTADARRVRALLPASRIDFAFIDADHSHPMPLFDVLHLAPWMKPEGWIALHDVALPELYPQYQSHGPLWLFRAWPGTKLDGSATGAPNIGAIRLPRDLTDLIPMANMLLDAREWEYVPSTSEIDLPILFGTVQSRASTRLR